MMTSYMALFLSFLLFTTCVAAPVEKSLKDTLNKEDDSLLLLVPSVPKEKENDVLDANDVEYDLILIPGDVLRREVGQTGHNYGPLDNRLHEAIDGGKNDRSGDSSGSVLTAEGQSTLSSKLTSAQLDQLALDAFLHGEDDAADVKQSNHDKRSFFGNNNNNNNDNRNSDENADHFDIGDIVQVFNKGNNQNNNNNNDNDNNAADTLRGVGSALRVGSDIVTGVSHVVSKFSGGGSGGGGGGSGQQRDEGLRTITNIIKSKLNLPGARNSNNQNNILGGLGGVGQVFALGGTVVGGLSKILGKLGGNRGGGQGGGQGGGLGNIGDLGGNIISGIRELKKGAQGAGGGLRGFAEAASDGFRYVGRLSTSILRILLQIPGIKARVLTEIVQAGTPVTTAISDVIGENADDMRQLIEAGTSIIRDAFDVLIRLVTDVLALKGRVLASLGANGLDAGSSLFDGGLRIGGAVVQSAGDIASAVGRGVGEVVQVVSEADIPPLPQLPQLPNLGSLFGGRSVASSAEHSYNAPGNRRR